MENEGSKEQPGLAFIVTERSGLSARENMAGRMRMRRDRGNEVKTEKFLRSGLEREVRSIRNPFRPGLWPWKMRECNVLPGPLFIPSQKERGGVITTEGQIFTMPAGSLVKQNYSRHHHIHNPQSERSLQFPMRNEWCFSH